MITAHAYNLGSARNIHLYGSVLTGVISARAAGPPTTYTACSSPVGGDASVEAVALAELEVAEADQEKDALLLLAMSAAMAAASTVEELAVGTLEYKEGVGETVAVDAAGSVDDETAATSTSNAPTLELVGA